VTVGLRPVAGTPEFLNRACTCSIAMG